MKKLICLMLVVVFASSLLAGCEWNEWLKENPDDQVSLTLEETISEMKWEYLRKNNITKVSYEKVLIEHCAGFYNGYLVAMIDATRHTYEKATVNVGGVDFTYFDGNRLIAYKNGEFLSLEEAYNKGILSTENLAEIEKNFSDEKTYYYEFCDIHDYPITGQQGTPYFLIYQMEETFDRLKMVLEYGGELPPISFYNTGNPNDPTVIEVVDKSLSDFNNYYKGKLFCIEIVFDRFYSGYELAAYVTTMHNKPGVLYVDSLWHPMVDSINMTSTTEYGSQWGLDDINVRRVWDFSTGSYTVGVGIIDTGISVHSDLVNNLNTIYSRDYKNNSQIANDDVKGHGTFVAGIIGSEWENGIGINGVNQYVTLYSLQVLDYPSSTDYLPEADIGNDIDAIIRAINAVSTSTFSSHSPVRIVNYSIQGVDYVSEEMFQKISDFNGLFVASAGNIGFNIDTNPIYPQSYDLDNIIVVGGLDRNDNLVFWDDEIQEYRQFNYGPNSVDIYAPAINIYSTLPNDTYGFDSGTSFAAPYVSGVAALLLSIKNDLTPAQLKECIVNGGKDITIYPLNDEPHAVKKLDAFGAMKYMFDHYFVDEYTLTNSDVEIVKTMLPINEYFTDLNSMAKLNFTEAGDYTFNISSTTPIDIYFYDSNLNLISITEGYDASQMNVDFSKYLRSGTYYLRIDYGYTPYEYNTATISIDYSEHFHEYTKWVIYSPTKHIECCECGATGTVKGNHVVRSSDIDGIKSKCILCGALIDSFGGIGESIIQNIQKVTLNGSYILPNGIIVLVDEDVEAYLNGTLVFYDKNNLPQTQ